MSHRKKILIIIIVAAGILLLIYWLFLRPKYLAPPASGPSANVNATLPPLALPAVNVAPAVLSPEVPDEEKIRSDIGRLAAAFAERFGSYSNQGNFENLLDLKPLMTPQMRGWADDLIEKNRMAQDDNSIYSGVTAKAVSTNIADFDKTGGTAKVIVSVQKREASGSMVDNVKISYQSLELMFQRVGEEWKVDEARWK